MRFWDSSALVPLVVGQAASRTAESWLAEDGVLTVWTLSGVEIASALWRLVREGVVPEQAAREAEALADEVLRRVHVIGDVERVKALARRLLRVHGLRAADALQLGAALSWADGHPEDLVMHTLDRRLGAAAEREGFHVVRAP